MTVTANGIDLAQPPIGAATTLGVRQNFQAIDAALTALLNQLNAGVSLAPVLASLAIVPAGSVGALEKTGSTSVGTFTVTSFAKTMLAAATSTGARSALGLGSAATSATTDFAAVGHTHPALSPFSGDTGSGGVLGTVPGPAPGDAAATKYLGADGSWKQLQGTLGGNLSCGGKVIAQPELSNYRETYFSYGNAAGAVPLNYSNGTYQTCTLTGNATFTIAGWPPANKGGALILIVTQDGTGGRTATFSGVKWPGGSAPVIATGAGQVSILTFLTINAGTPIYGFIGGLNFS